MLAARPRVFRVLLTALSLTVLVLSAPWAHAGTALPRVVSTNPSNWTPNIVEDGTNAHPVAYGIWQVGQEMYVGGSFHAIRNSGSGANIVRTNIAAFSASNGKVSTSFAPRFDGAVWQIRGDAGGLFVVGEFTHVNGVARRGIAKIDPTTGALISSFDAGGTVRSGIVHDVRVTGGRVVIGGTFPKALAALSPSTGADTGYLNLGISGSVATNAGPTKVYRFEVSPDGSRLVAIGNFTSVAGQGRRQAFMVDLGSTGRLDPWYYAHLDDECHSTSIPAYLRDVDFDPSGRWFVLVASGNVAPHRFYDVCDATARFETNVAKPDKPTWINYTGGDTLDSVAASSNAVYVQGHPRWMDNPFGRNTCGAGCVERPGIAALDPSTGKALSWNPTKDRGVGGRDLLLTPQGLWVVSDTKQIGHETHQRVALLPE